MTQPRRPRTSCTTRGSREPRTHGSRSPTRRSRFSPLCADAYVLLAQEAAGSVEEARDYFARGVEAGKLALGPEGFEEYAGHFWGFLETRPYMRARAGLANTLLQLGDTEGAIGHFRDMLGLNPNDNQGIRYTLLACLLRQDDADAVNELLAAYANESSVFWAYTRVLLAFRAGRMGDRQTATLINDAVSANEHVPGVLAGTKPPAEFRRRLHHGGRCGRSDRLRQGMRCGLASHARRGRMVGRRRGHPQAKSEDAARAPLTPPFPRPDLACRLDGILGDPLPRHGIIPTVRMIELFCGAHRVMPTQAGIHDFAAHTKKSRGCRPASA